MCAAAALCIPRLAHAEADKEAPKFAVALEYAADPGCPAIDELKAVVVGRLRYDPFDDDAPNRAFVRLSSRGRAIEGRVEWRDSKGRWAGERTFPSRTNDCRDLVRAVGFALALQIQFLAIVSVHDAAPPPSPPPPPPPPEPTLPS